MLSQSSPWFSLGSCVKKKKLESRGDQAEKHSTKSVMCKQQTRLRGSFRKRDHRALHVHFCHRLVMVPSSFRFPTLKPNFPKPGQRCKWRLVCEWVCTVTSVSVRIEKRANYAKNNKPKSGWLFLVNTRPFPEQLTSIATFSTGRAWLVARALPCEIPEILATFFLERRFLPPPIRETSPNQQKSISQCPKHPFFFNWQLPELFAVWVFRSELPNCHLINSSDFTNGRCSQLVLVVQWAIKKLL